MDLRSLDLNLLVVFDAMLRHRSVTRASEAIGLASRPPAPPWHGCARCSTINSS